MTEALLRTAVRAEPDIFVVRQRGREVATAVGLDYQDQVRVATALSEVARELLTRAAGGTVVFSVAAAPEPVLVITVSISGDVRAGGAADVGEIDGEGFAAAARLMDSVRASGRDVVLTKRLPQTALPAADRVRQLRETLAASAPASPLDELSVQNRQLITALEEVQQQRDDLLRLNHELTETNQGVMALYGQLSEELEQTNQGVVALYGELDQRSAQLREASEAKSRFLANVSHELRAPVAAMLGLTRLLLDAGSDPLTADQREQLALVQTSGEHLLGLVNELLDLAKAESNRIDPNWSEVDLRSLFGQLRGTLRSMAKPDVELVVVDPEVRTVVSDEVLLGHILRNLLTNGLKFTERGEVRLTATGTSAGGLTLVVADTGIGIPPDEQERVFEEFYQVRSSMPGTPGTGLGLPFARRLAVLLGGDLTLRSTPGQGSVFTVRLPGPPPMVSLSAPASPATSAAASASPAVSAAASAFTSPTASAAPAPASSPVPASSAVSAPASASDSPPAASVVPAASPQAESSVVPAASAVAESAAASTASPPAGPGPGPGLAAGSGRSAAVFGRLLVVDDVAGFRRTLREVLAPYARSIVEAPDGRTAMEAARRDPPDAIVLDLLMPIMDGIAMLGALACDERLSQVPVIVVTGADLTLLPRDALRHATVVMDKADVNEEVIGAVLAAIRAVPPP